MAVNCRAAAEADVKTVLSFGAGVQTTALLVLIAEGKWPRPDAIVFADTGNEQDETYAYLGEVSGPYARRHDLKITVLGADWRTSTYQGDLETYCLEHRMVPGAWQRWCTSQYKIRPIMRFCKREMGASAKTPIESWIGISSDESKRAKPSPVKYTVNRYPLIELGMSRASCEAVTAAAGLPPAPKSGCWFCPFQKQSKWHQLKRDKPELFARALHMEVNASTKAGKAQYLPLFGSLERIAAQDELPGFDDLVEAEAGCVTGSCFV